jgi:antitoxin component YwqK of YwqJK toxin-antitoxin module
MKQSLFSTKILVGLLVFLSFALAQEEIRLFDPNAVNPEFFKTVKNEQILKDKFGTLYKVKNTQKHKGVSMLVIKKGKEYWKRHGRYYRFHDNGSVSQVTTYKIGRKHGQFKSFHENGTLRSEVVYSSNSRQGQYKQYYPDGSLFETSFYVDNNREGICVNYYDGEGDSTGPMHLKTEYVKNKKHGEQKEYNRQGALIKTRFFSDNREVKKEKKK